MVLKKWLENFAYHIDIGFTAFLLSALLAFLILFLTVFGQAYKASQSNPEVVAHIIKQLHDQGKGIVGMKLIGNGNFRNDPEKIDTSLSYVMSMGAVDTLIIGFEKPEEIDDYAIRVEKTLKISPFVS